MITKRRLASLSRWDKKEYEINPKKLEVAEEIRNKEFFSQEEFFSFVKHLITREEIDYIKLGIYILRCHITTLQVVQTEIIRKEQIFEVLLDLMEVFIKDDVIIVKYIKYIK
jgi:hypothetical protein